jgi:hypothetical protein
MAPPLEKVGDLLADAKFAPCGPVAGHDRIKHCSSLPDLIGRHLLVQYCGRDELAHVPLPGDAGSGGLPKIEGRFTQREGR